MNNNNNNHINSDNPLTSRRTDGGKKHINVICIEIKKKLTTELTLYIRPVHGGRRRR